MNFTYDPYYMDYFDLPIYVDKDFDCNFNYYLNPFYNPDLDSLHGFMDPSDPYFIDFLCLYYNTTWDPFVLWWYYKQTGSTTNFVQWAATLLGQTTTTLSFANLGSYVSGGKF